MKLFEESSIWKSDQWFKQSVIEGALGGGAQDFKQKEEKIQGTPLEKKKKKQNKWNAFINRIKMFNNNNNNDKFLPVQLIWEWY